MTATPETAAWIEAQLELVFDRYPAKSVEATMPVLLLVMARDFGIDDLSPKIQDAVVEVLQTIGLTEGMAPRDVEEKTKAFIEERAVDNNLLRDVADVLNLHYAAVDGRATDDFRKLVDDPPQKSAPKVGDAPPPNTQSGEAVKRQGLGKIRS